MGRYKFIAVLRLAGPFGRPALARPRRVRGVTPTRLSDFHLKRLRIRCDVLSQSLQPSRGDGVPVERDMHFEADKTLSAYAEEARAEGRIVSEAHNAAGLAGGVLRLF